MLLPDSCYVLVGNGPSLLGSNKGSVIDGFDEVIRFNDFRIAGFENHVGSKTTAWVTFGRGMIPKDVSWTEKVILSHHCAASPYKANETYKIPQEFYDNLRTIVKVLTDRADEQKNMLLPTSGLLIAWWLLNVIKVKKVHLAGFDHFKKDKSGLHHYWIDKAFGKPKEHDGDVECELLKSQERLGRVEYIT